MLPHQIWRLVFQEQIFKTQISNYIPRLLMINPYHTHILFGAQFQEWKVRFYIKQSYHYRKSHYREKTILRQSDLYNGIPCTHVYCMVKLYIYIEAGLGRSMVHHRRRVTAVTCLRWCTVWWFPCKRRVGMITAMASQWGISAIDASPWTNDGPLDNPITDRQIS